MDIFLSASVPLPERNRRYFETADVLAIREAIKALVEIVLPVGRITFGGHPAITPLVAFFIREAGIDSSHLTIFQSRFFEHVLPEENERFLNIEMTNAVAGDRDQSLLVMRTAMIGSRDFKAAVFIGGMEGIAEEARLVQQIRPRALMMPIASTGGGALDVFNAAEYPIEFSTDLTYATLFRRYLLR